MVKKHKGGRRQILQLEDKRPSREWEPTSSGVSNKEATPLDSQVADFFKGSRKRVQSEKTHLNNQEIDALTVNDRSDEGNSEAACAPSEVASCSKQNEQEDLKSQDGLPEKSEGNSAEGSKTEGNYCPWQEICDESTGYNYYWNVETNDVTWDCPSEYIIYLKNLQSTDGEGFPQSNQSNSNENHKKGKRKKVPPQPPEGAIIPISYFGNSSSSDDSSDEEKENGLDTTSKHIMHRVEPKPPGHKVGKKNDYHNNENKKEIYGDIMGPHLPHDNHISKTVSSASRTFLLNKEAEMSSRNEVDEYFEIGPQLASNSGIDLSKNSDCNTVSDSSSKCSSIPHSVRNGPSDASSSTYEEPWEVSLMNIERKFRGLDQDIGEESPDSTVRKGDNLSENSVPCQTSNDTIGVRGVVEYDNFTDEEEEMSSSNISSSKQEEVTAKRASPSGYNKSRDRDSPFKNQRKHNSSKSEVTQSETQRNLPKRKFLGKTDDYEDSNLKKSKQKDRVDIDSIFNNHGNNGKYGFGFSRQEQLNLESDFFCSTSSHNHPGSNKASGDYKAISFVKSDHVFDLSILNKNISSDNSSQSKPNEREPCNNNNNESIYAPGPSGLNGVNEVNDSKATVSIESNCVYNDPNSKEKNVDTSNSVTVKSSQYLNTKPSTSKETKEQSSEQKDVSSSRVNDTIYKMEEDIDEIDRQLSEALEAKKAEHAASKPSSSSPSVSPKVKQCETEPSVSKKISIESAKPGSDGVNNGSLSDDIVNLSSLLIDKLTFLITNHSTLTSLSSLLIQIQTRLMDWQSGSLESRYFMSRLQEVQQYLQHYEMGAVSGDWTCQWDRENKRYFYMNNRTQISQWTYPEELCGKENSWMPSSTDLATTSSASSELSVERDELQTVSSSVPEGQLHNKSSTFTAESSKGISDKYSDSSSMWISDSSPPPPPPGVDSPPPPPPQSPPPDSPPPPPPDSTEVEDLLEDMDIENSDDSNPPLIVTNSRADLPADTHMQYPKFAIPSPERSSENFISASVTNAVSSTSLSGFEDMNTVSKSPQLVSTSRDSFDTADSVNMHWSMSQPSCSTDVACNFDSESEANVLPDPKLLPQDKDSDANASSSSSRSCDAGTVNASSSSSRSYICSNEVMTYRKPCGPYPSTSTSGLASTTSTSRKEKKKAKLSSGLALKKKNIPSLVEKWQKIKEEQDKEDKDSEDPRN